MIKITTETRVLENWSMYPYSNTRYYQSDKVTDEFLGKLAPEERDGFTVKLIAEPTTSMFVAEKPASQTILETASPEEIQAVEENNKSEQLAIAVKRKGIDLPKEMESWLGTIASASSRRTYHSSIKNHFLKYCEQNGINPVMFSPEDARKFVKWLYANGASTPTIRSTISSCKKLFTSLWENHEIPAQTNPFGSKSLLPRKGKRVKLLLVPDQTDSDRFLDYAYAKGNLIVYTAIKLIVKHGMRIGAFRKMKVKGKKAVTESKGGTHSFIFDDEDIALLKDHPLNEFTAAQLGGRVNYHLEQAYESGVTKERFSAHDFRHFFAIKFYTEKEKEGSLNHNGIVHELSKKMGHKNISPTPGYLDSLKKESL
jgi:integrase